MDNNVYYYPEKFGLTVVGEVEWSEPDYSFDTTVLWRDESGEFVWGSDSGCSCPAPFEYIELSDLHRGSFHDFAEYLNEKLEESYSDSNREYAAPKVVDLLVKASNG